MPPVDGYALSEKDLRLIREFLYVYNRQQRYVNAFGRGPDNKIDHEEMHTSELYIARSPVGGIPALQSMGSTGIGDIPGSALCMIFKTSQSADLTEDVTGYQQTVYNLSTSAIPGDTWLIIVRDKYGKWYALQTISSEQFDTITGPGWTAGLSNEDCLLLTITNAIGKCSTVPAQEILLISDDAITWEGLDNFVYSGGIGQVQFTRLANHSLPTLTIGPYTLIYDKSGIDSNGKSYIEYKGGTSLCSDIEGTGSGTGGARASCGSNTVTIRLTCDSCYPDVIETICCDNALLPTRMYLEFYDGTADAAELNGTIVTLDYYEPAAIDLWLSNCVVLPGGSASQRIAVSCARNAGPNPGGYIPSWSTVTEFQVLQDGSCNGNRPLMNCWQFWGNWTVPIDECEREPFSEETFTTAGGDRTLNPPNGSGKTGTIKLRVKRNL